LVTCLACHTTRAVRTSRNSDWSDVVAFHQLAMAFRLTATARLARANSPQAGANSRESFTPDLLHR
jgi:hypothetical protein